MRQELASQAEPGQRYGLPVVQRQRMAILLQ